MLFGVQVFQTSDFLGSGSKVRVEVLELALSLCLQPYQKVTPTGVFMWILENFQEQLLCKTTILYYFFFLNSVNNVDAIGFYLSLQYKRFDRTLLKRRY